MEFHQFMYDLNDLALAIPLLKSLTSLAAIYQGYHMINRLQENEEIFQKWAFTNADIRVYGWMTVAAALLLFVPAISFWAALVTAFSMFVTLAVQLSIRNKRILLIQLPFFALNLLLMVLQNKTGTMA